MASNKPLLQNLPEELLLLICEHLGGRELRRGKGVPKLLLFRKWTKVAHPVFLSGIDLAAIALYGHNLQALQDGKWSYARGNRQLMHKNTRNLYIRLVGHWWDQNSSQAFEELLAKEEYAGKNGVIDASGYDPQVPNVPPPGSIRHDGKTAHEPPWKVWRDGTLTPTLDDLGRDVKHFEALELLTLEVAFDIPPAGMSLLYAYTLSRLCRKLPWAHDLTDLTLDTWGTNIMSNSDDRQSGSDDADGVSCHLCEALAVVLPKIKHVRLRMRCICPAVFEHSGKSLVISADEVKCKTLVLKLHLPRIPWANLPSRSARHCDQAGEGKDLALLAPMVAASQQYLKWLASVRTPDESTKAKDIRAARSPAIEAAHGMDLLRISYANESNIKTVDCLTMRDLSTPEDFFTYEEDGMPSWFEYREDLVDCGRHESEKKGKRRG